MNNNLLGFDIIFGSIIIYLGLTRLGLYITKATLMLIAAIKENK